MREIVDGILMWSWFSEPHGYDFNGHLVRDPGGNICVDPVEPTDDDFDAITREGAKRIILTNRNHSRAANRVRASTGARTAIHTNDADHARSQDTEIDYALAVDGQEHGVFQTPDEAADALFTLAKDNNLAPSFMILFEEEG